MENLYEKCFEFLLDKSMPFCGTTDSGERYMIKDGYNDNGYYYIINKSSVDGYTLSIITTYENGKIDKEVKMLS